MPAPAAPVAAFTTAATSASAAATAAGITSGAAGAIAASGLGTIPAASFTAGAVSGFAGQGFLSGLASFSLPSFGDIGFGDFFSGFGDFFSGFGADFFKFNAGDLLIGTGSLLLSGGQVQAGFDTQSIFDLQAAIEKNRALRERQIAQLEADDFRRRMTATRRTLPTRLEGVQFVGTPLIVDDVLASDIQRGVDRILAGGDAQGAEAEASAVLAELRGDAAVRRGVTSAGASLLTGAGEIFS